jgi:hypothetical protein
LAGEEWGAGKRVTSMTDRAASAGGSGSRPHLGLSGKLLRLTIAFVMAEVLIYVPSTVRFR